MRGEIRHILWDWNGTLLDDVECCVETINSLLAERGMDPLTRGQYGARFGFPVRDFYEGLGFDLQGEDFGRVAQVWMERYRARIPHMQTQTRAHEVVGELSRLGVQQSVLSAMEAELLHAMLERFGLRDSMTHVRGLGDHQGHSKVQLGQALLEELELASEQVLLVGDTLHDLETAQAMGCHCLLYAGGHQTHDRLAASGYPVVRHLDEIVERVSPCAE